MPIYQCICFIVHVIYITVDTNVFSCIENLLCWYCQWIKLCKHCVAPCLLTTAKSCIMYIYTLRLSVMKMMIMIKFQNNNDANRYWFAIIIRGGSRIFQRRSKLYKILLTVRVRTQSTRHNILTIICVKPLSAFLESKHDIFTNIYEPLSPSLMRKSTVQVETGPHVEENVYNYLCETPLLHFEIATWCFNQHLWIIFVYC